MVVNSLSGSLDQNGNDMKKTTPGEAPLRFFIDKISLI